MASRKKRTAEESQSDESAEANVIKFAFGLTSKFQTGAVERAITHLESLLEYVQNGRGKITATAGGNKTIDHMEDAIVCSLEIVRALQNTETSCNAVMSNYIKTECVSSVLQALNTQMETCKIQSTVAAANAAVSSALRDRKKRQKK